MLFDEFNGYTGPFGSVVGLCIFIPFILSILLLSPFQQGQPWLPRRARHSHAPKHPCAGPAGTEMNGIFAMQGIRALVTVHEGVVLIPFVLSISSPFILFIPVEQKPRMMSRRWNRSRRSTQHFFLDGIEQDERGSRR